MTKKDRPNDAAAPPRTAWPWGILLTLLILAGLPLLAPQNPYDLALLDVMDARLPPLSTAASGAHYWLGSDAQGRDLLSAILYGLRISLWVGLAGTLLAATIGTLLGLCAGFRGGWMDNLLMRLADLQLSFPAFLIALVLLALLGPGLGKVVLAIALSQWAWFARLTRTIAQREKGKDYIVAAQLLGTPNPTLLRRHLLPNCLPALLPVLPAQLAAAMTLEATLSFLGLGAPVTEPSLGLLIANGYQYLLTGSYWISLFPGIALFLLIAISQGLADRLSPVARSH